MENIDQHTQSLSELLQAFAPLMQTYRNMSAAAASFQQSTAALKMQFTELNPLIQTQTTLFQAYFSTISALVTKLSELKESIGTVTINITQNTSAGSDWYDKLLSTIATLSSFKEHLTMLGSPLKEVGSAIARVTLLTWQNTVATFRNVFAMVVQKAALVAQKTAMIAQKAALVAQKVVTGVLTIANWALNASLFANPVMLIVLGIAALIAGLVLAWNKLDWFREGILSAWEVIKDFGKVIFDALLAPFKAVWGTIKKVGKALGGFLGFGGSDEEETKEEDTSSKAPQIQSPDKYKQQKHPKDANGLFGEGAGGFDVAPNLADGLGIESGGSGTSQTNTMSLADLKKSMSLMGPKSSDTDTDIMAQMGLGGNQDGHSAPDLSFPSPVTAAAPSPRAPDVHLHIDNLMHVESLDISNSEDLKNLEENMIDKMTQTLTRAINAATSQAYPAIT